MDDGGGGCGGDGIAKPGGERRSSRMLERAGFPPPQCDFSSGPRQSATPLRSVVRRSCCRPPPIRTVPLLLLLLFLLSSQRLLSRRRFYRWYHNHRSRRVLLYLLRVTHQCDASPPPLFLPKLTASSQCGVRTEVLFRLSGFFPPSHPPRTFCRASSSSKNKKKRKSSTTKPPPEIK